MQSHLLSARNIHKNFGKTEVLKGITLNAGRGDIISIIGSSGSGKSTLLRCMNLLEIPDEGSLTFQGQEIGFKKCSYGRVPADKKQVKQLRIGLCMVFQQFNLWTHMTVMENIMEAPINVLKMSSKDASEKALHYLNKVGMYERRNHYPSQLSGGQQQRIGIARALAMEPEAILFDEPTSALDPELVSEVLNVMTDLAKEGRTMLVVTHEMSFAKEISNQIIFLHLGKIEEQGDSEKLFANPSSERLKKFLSAIRH